MASPAALIEQTTRRLVYQSRVNTAGFFLSVMVLTAILCHYLFSLFSLPATLVLAPLFLLSTLMIHCLVQAQRVIRREEVAALLDEKTDGQERFLTYATLSPLREDEPFFLLLQRQATRKAATFDPSRDVPLTLDRRVLLALSAVALSTLLLFVFPPTPIRSPLTHQGIHGDTETEIERLARELMKRETVQEQATGAQLLALAEELKNPLLSPQEKQRLIEQAQQRLNLTLPLPQLLSFDLQLFASDRNNKQGPSAHSDQPQAGNAPLAKSDQPQEHPRKSLSAAAGKEPYPGPPQEGDSKESAKPRTTGGGIQFNLPPPQSERKEERAGGESTGQRQQTSPDHPPVWQGQGTDPHRLGGQQAQEQGPDVSGQQPQPRGAGTTVGGATGERFLRPGEQPGGFLTKDARFVKVRVPGGQETAAGDKRTASHGRPTAKTPYSNTPLKAGTPDQPQPRQPVPLEYRAILQPQL
jgi:hypothetical protein